MVRQVNPFALLDDEDSEDLTSVLAKVEANLAKLKNVVPQDHARTPQGAAVPFAGRGRGRGGFRAGENGGRNAGGGDGFQYAAGRGEEENGGWRTVDGSRGRGRVYFQGRGYGNGYVRRHAGVESAGEGGEIVAASGEVGLERGSHVQVNGNGGGDGFQYVAGRGEGENGGWRSVGGSRGRGGVYFQGRGYGNGYLRRHAGVESAGEGDEIGAASGEVGLEWGSHVQVNGNGGGKYRFRGGYNGIGRGLRGRGGGGRWYGRGGRWVAKEEAAGQAKEGTGEPTSVVDGESGSDAAIVTEVAEQQPVEAGKVEVVSEKPPAEKVADEDENKMTLLEYEKLLIEKRKALEIVKNEGRQVDEKDFEGMQIVDRKTEDDTVVKVKSAKEKPNKVSTDKEKPHKVRDTMSINEFLKPMKGARYYGPPSYARARYAERLNNIKAEEKDASDDVGQQPTKENGGMKKNASSSNGVAGPKQSSILSSYRPDTEIQLADSKQFPGLTPASKA